MLMAGLLLNYSLNRRKFSKSDFMELLFFGK